MFKLPMKDTYTMRKVRGNIEEALISITKGAFREGASARKTAMFIDNLIDFCEAINIYDDGELRNIYVSKLEEGMKNENSKKEH